MPGQIIWFATAFTFGEGLIVILKLTGVPEHVVPPRVRDGTTVKVLVKGVVLAFVAVKPGMFPTPEVDGKPMLSVVLVQLKIVPAGLPDNVVADINDPLQCTWLATAFALGVGLTDMVNDVDVPIQDTPF